MRSLWTTYHIRWKELARLGESTSAQVTFAAEIAYSKNGSIALETIITYMHVNRLAGMLAIPGALQV